MLPSRSREESAMKALNPTPIERLLDHQGRPYFLWDLDMTLDTFRARLRDPDAAVRAFLVAKLMRQAKPDDVFAFVTLKQIRELWPQVQPYLGDRRPFWTWLLDAWEGRGRDAR
jgi:hypothetical protein